VQKECYVGVLETSRVVLFMHDEIMLETPEEYAFLVAPTLASIMVAGMAKFIPDVPITTTPVVMRRWYKGAKPVYVDGKLVPSKPEGGKWVADVA
jgi:hypothetical protein